MFSFTDAYEFTMIETALQNGLADTLVVAEIFARDLPDEEGIFWGRETIRETERNYDVEEIKKHLQELENQGYCFTETIAKLDQWVHPIIRTLPEGQRFVPFMPVVQIEGPFWSVILRETVFCGIVNHESRIATEANRFVKAANEKPICDMSARRSHPLISDLQSNIAVNVGFASTSILSQSAQNPVTGTCSHSLPVLYRGLGLTETQAYKDHVKQMGPTGLPIDGYDWEDALSQASWLPEGSNVRFDSGDLEKIVPKAREMLNQMGRQDIKISVCGRLTPEMIREREELKLPVDAYGVGTKLTDTPSLGMVYKIVEVEGRPEAKQNANKKVHASKKYVVNTGAQIVVTPMPPSSGYQNMLVGLGDDVDISNHPILVLDSSSKIGLFSGTFDPPHIGHEVCVKNILKEDIDVLFVSVTGSPWYKEPSPGAERLCWSHKSFDQAKVLILDAEIRGGYECAYELLEDLGVYFKDITSFVGTDANFDKWKKLERVQALSKFKMLQRPGYPNETSFDVLEFDVPAISSTQIRSAGY